MKLKLAILAENEDEFIYLLGLQVTTSQLSHEVRVRLPGMSRSLTEHQLKIIREQDDEVKKYARDL